jgi:hypothetical protein
MKRISPILVLAMLGSWTAAAQDSATVQGGSSAQSQTSVKTGKAGTQASSNESASSSASANEGNNWAGIYNGTKIEATLADSLDAKKNKPGDRVEARTTEDVKEDGKVVLKRGTRLVGHVTQAQARAKEQSQSQLGIMFDHAVLKDGREVPFSATVQALAMAQSSAVASTGADNMMASGGGMGAASGNMHGGGLVSGLASTAGATAGSVTNVASSAPANLGGATNMAVHSSGAVGGLSSDGRLISNSSGVFGLQGLSIDSAASSATQSSMIVSSTRNVHLDSGTQVLLSASGQAK